MVGVKGAMRATLVTPDGPGPFPGILVLHTSGGLQRADTDFAERLAEEGYVALVPAFLDAYGITAPTRTVTFTSDAEPIYADLVAALETLRHTDQVSGRKLGAIGFSNGGYFAAWLAASGKVAAGISYYGALTGAGTDRSLDRFRETFTAESAPLLILHGTQDQTMSVAAAQRLAGILADTSSPYQLHLYPGAGHRFERDTTTEANRVAAADAWRRSLAFLLLYLRDH
jgi:carboxymethylenebutenolidase